MDTKEFTAFFDCGNINYTIVIPSVSTENEIDAVKELVSVLGLATKTNWDYVSDDHKKLSPEDKILSIGKTKFLRDSNIDVKKLDLKEDGFLIKTLDDNIFICGGGDKGTLYGVYHFLQIAVGYKAFAGDEISYNSVNRIFLTPFDIKVNPDFEFRALNFTLVNNDKNYRNKMRINNEDNGWILWAHTFFQLLPQDTYLSDHPDWYSEDRTQLCLTNNEMSKEFIKNVIEQLKQNTTYRYIMLGQEDFYTICKCEKCNLEIEKYMESGYLMRFVNNVAREVKKWIDENQPGREIDFVTFAYQKTVKAPVVKQGNIVKPIDNSVIAEKNVGVMVAPLYACYSHPFFSSDCNHEVKEVIESWNIICKKLFMWSYCTNFYVYMLPFYNFDAIKSNYREFKNNNFKYLFDQGTREDCVTSFQALRIFIHSQLMWDIEQDEVALAKEFIKNYYKSASQKMEKIFFDLLNHFRKIDKNFDIHAYPSNGRGTAMENKKVFDKSFIKNSLNDFEKALQCIQDEQEPLKSTLTDRIKRESVAYRYLLIQLYLDEMDINQASVEIERFKNDCLETDINCYGEWPETSGKTITNKLLEWQTYIDKNLKKVATTIN